MLSRQEEMEDRKEYLENEKRLREQGSTFLAHTHNDTGGRYAAISSPNVVGSESIPKYPAAYLHHDPVPTVPPLGVEVNAMEPTGESFEVARSVRPREPDPGRSSVISCRVQETTNSVPPSPGGRAGLVSFSSRTYRRA